MRKIIFAAIAAFAITGCASTASITTDTQNIETNTATIAKTGVDLLTIIAQDLTAAVTGPIDSVLSTVKAF